MGKRKGVRRREGGRERRREKGREREQSLGREQLKGKCLALWREFFQGRRER